MGLPIVVFKWHSLVEWSGSIWTDFVEWDSKHNRKEKRETVFIVFRSWMRYHHARHFRSFNVVFNLRIEEEPRDSCFSLSFGLVKPLLWHSSITFGKRQPFFRSRFACSTVFFSNCRFLTPVCLPLQNLWDECVSYILSTRWSFCWKEAKNHVRTNNQGMSVVEPFRMVVF